MEKVKSLLTKANLSRFGFWLLVATAVVVSGLAIKTVAEDDSTSNEVSEKENIDSTIRNLDYTAEPIDLIISDSSDITQAYSRLNETGFALRSAGQYERAVEYFLAASELEGATGSQLEYSVYVASLTAELYDQSRAQELLSQLSNEAVDRLSMPLDDESGPGPGEDGDPDAF